jgi:ankyrin repeat protein
VNELIISGADVNFASERYGFTPLMFAAAYGQRDVVYLLIESNAVIDMADKDGNTALHHAAEGLNDSDENALEVVLVLRQGNWNVCNAKGERPVDIAKKKNNPNIIKMLEE